MKKYSLLIVFIGLMSCVEDINHNAIDTKIINPDISDKTEITFKQLYHLHNNTIGKDTVVTGYVVSSDQQGNFYKEIFVQNTFDAKDIGDDNPRMGIKMRIGLNTTSVKYGKGRKIIINLEGLKKTTSDNLLTLGKPSQNYIKDILEFELDHHILKTPEVQKIIPKEVTLSGLQTNDLNTLVSIKNLHFKPSQVALPYAGLPTDEYDGLRILEFCDTSMRDSIFLETSNFADFASDTIPNKQINITGIYHMSFDDEQILILNEIDDIKEIGPYITCPEIITPDLMMTEVADAKVASGEKVRYVEVYNTTDKTVSLEGWTLVRYNKTSANKYAYHISLDDVSVEPKTAFLVANNVLDFEKYFGFVPIITNSNIDGNGDDAYELIDPLGEVKDVYGVPNIDGTGLVWDYEDGVAIRKKAVLNPNNVFDAAEWEIKKDRPSLSATQENLDFTPGVR